MKNLLTEKQTTSLRWYHLNSCPQYEIQQHEHEAWSKGNCTALTLCKAKSSSQIKGCTGLCPTAHYIQSSLFI